MTDDIVASLRAYDVDCYTCSIEWNSRCECACHKGLPAKAADEIERLRAEVGELRSAAPSFGGMVAKSLQLQTAWSLIQPKMSDGLTPQNGPFIQSGDAYLLAMDDWQYKAMAAVLQQCSYRCSIDQEPGFSYGWIMGIRFVVELAPDWFDDEAQP